MDAKQSSDGPAPQIPSFEEKPLPLITKPASWSSPSEASSTPETSPKSTSRGDAGKNAAPKHRRPHKASTAASKSTLFWVHTDPQSASGSKKEETLKRIRSHVMSEHNRKKRLENAKRYKGKTWKNLAFQPVEPIIAGRSSTSPVELSPGTSPDRGSIAYSDQSDDSLTTYFPMRNGSGYTPALSLHDLAYPIPPTDPWTYLGQGSNDPFNVMQVPLSSRMQSHLQLFLCDLTRLAYPLMRQTNSRLQSHWASLVQKDPAPLHATICVAASNCAVRSGEFPLLDPTKSYSSTYVFDAFHHRGETIKLVNSGLSNPAKASSDALIAAVSILISIEIASGNPEDLKIHLAGLRQMVSLRSNFADVAPDVRFQISWTDIRVACMALTRPIFPFIRYSRPPQIPDLGHYCGSFPIASRLLSFAQIPGFFSTSMISTIYDLLDLTQYAECVKGVSGYPQGFITEEVEDYFNNEVLYVEYSIHRDRFTELGIPKGDHTVEGCVRLACLIFHNTSIWGFYPQMAAVFPKPISALKNALEITIFAGYYELCRDLLIWLLFIGASSTQYYHQRERSFFVRELATAVNLHGLESWQELRALLTQFFYIDRCYLQSCRDLWDEVQGVLLRQ
ncbi:transcriptional regulator family: Fungal Specific TF [Paecilomyces variotii]|nr:transcriptional regulator family: Fungal Specific TF [Paecilomyces variotii]